MYIGNSLETQYETRELNLLSGEEHFESDSTEKAYVVDSMSSTEYPKDSECPCM